MFTGLVERKAVVRSFSTEASGVWALTVETDQDFHASFGESIAVNGACLTEVAQVPSPGILTFHVSPETLARTALSTLKKGSTVNLERAMRPQDRLGGHIVLGHVDDVGTLSSVTPREQFVDVKVTVPIHLAKYLIIKGSICIDGVSLTINGLEDTQDSSHVQLMIIPVTWNKTRFSTLKVGDLLNIEVDMVAKHLERLALFSR